MKLRDLLLVEAAAFALAASVHSGVLLSGYAHRRAAIAESVLTAALLLGWLVGFARPKRARGAALAAQGLALLGTLVGLLMVFLGPGPQTGPDLVYHFVMVAVLAAGLVAMIRARS
jgi:hypothetical protein